MFSHSLVAYHAALLDFAAKTSYTFESALKILEEKPQYNFTVLKDLTQAPVVRDKPAESTEMTPIDFDQMLFFKVCSIYLPMYTKHTHARRLLEKIALKPPAMRFSLPGGLWGRYKTMCRRNVHWRK